MKKILSLILCIMLALFAVACGDGGSDVPGGGNGGGSDVPGGSGSEEGNIVEISIPKGWGGGAGTDYIIRMADYFNNSPEWGAQKIGKYDGAKIKLSEQDIPTSPANITTHGGDIISFDHRVGNILQVQPYVVDITDAMTATIPGEDKSIADKIPENVRAAYTNVDGTRYFGAPGSVLFCGYSIDTEMWERDGLYIANALLNNDPDYASKVAEYEDFMESEGFGAKKYVSNKYGITLWFSDYDGDGNGVYAIPGAKAVRNGNNYGISKEAFGEMGGLCVGPDGEAGTMDDGLPSSVIELLAFCDYIKSEEFECAANYYAPFALSGQYRDSYANSFLDGLYASLAGEQYQNSVLDFNSKGKKVRVVTGYTTENLYPGIDYIKKPVVQEVTITPETGYYVTMMEDKFYCNAALMIIQKEKYFGYAESNYVSHTETQKNFLFGGYDDKSHRDSCAFLIEGSFWSMEADRTGVESYAQLVQADDNAVNRRTEFASMPVNINEPVTEGNGDKNTLCAGLLGYTAINKKVEADPDKLAYCKLYIQFTRSEPLLAYQYWATHFDPIALESYEDVISNPEYESILADLGLNEKYYNEYHFERLRKLTSLDYSRKTYGVGDITLTMNFRTQTSWYNRLYYSGVFGVGGTKNAYQRLREVGVVQTFEEQMYTKSTWSNMYGSGYNNVADADKSYGGIAYNNG
ncbi:MAG: hypothetical protein J6V66_04210 [Clostridia bacterium]|nr:hypothetical protein [Clostridia bacterium]